MVAHELLRQAALILAAGHSKGADARDAAGCIVDLHTGANRALAFSPYGAICKAASQDQAPQLTSAMWRVLAGLASKHVGGTVHPLRDINELEDVTTSELVALLNEAADMIDPDEVADMIDPANTEPRTARASNRSARPLMIGDQIRAVYTGINPTARPWPRGKPLSRGGLDRWVLWDTRGLHCLAKG